jgi:hypothetical protein
MGGKQLGFFDYELTTPKKQTKREKFLSEMEAVVPWRALIALIEPHYPNARENGGSPPFSFCSMLVVPTLTDWWEPFFRGRIQPLTLTGGVVDQNQFTSSSCQPTNGSLLVQCLYPNKLHVRRLFAGCSQLRHN